ncbi:uncharacterized protein LOC121379088 [Gigantopelta aegis]|uniref:uncharacterized protein LOC121379088 n=1 Tax=Gigantopelta aegis TaxID=1735272 RepID=UPI001B88DAB4|nr:uncharacterized protein LOC121379088 [Gigantopelta aegis]
MLLAAAVVLIILLAQREPCLAVGESIKCSTSKDCGYIAVCANRQCHCPDSYTLHDNGKDCKDIKCPALDCLECTDNLFCKRCALYLVQETGMCLLNCSTQVVIQKHGRLVCKEAVNKSANNTDDKPSSTLPKDNCTLHDCLECSPEGKCLKCLKFKSATTGLCLEECNGHVLWKEHICKEDDKNAGTDNDTIIAVVAGVAAGVLLIIIVTVCACCYVRKTRKKINLQEKSYKSGQMEMGKLRQIPHYDNKAFEMDNIVDFHASVVDAEVYLQQLEQLRPHMDMLMTVLSDIRRKLRGMEPNDPRVPTYKGVIHQLCRVLVLLHKKDPTTSIPSDALGLIEWAQQMLEDHREQEEHSSFSIQDSPVNRISYIDVDLDKLNSHVYATPIPPTANHNVMVQNPSSSHNTSGYYSSVPVPLGTNLNNMYATINRSPANPIFHGNQNLNNTTAATKLWSFKKVNNTAKSRTVNNYPKAYFANGRYYDPNPQTEVYAPASSYSDRSAGPLSTFIGDRPRSGSLSTNAASNGDENVDELDDDYDDGEGLPFDPREATDPVEV